MALTLKLKKMTQAELLNYTGDDGEILINSTNNTLVVMDGVTLGGQPFRPLDRVSAKDYISINNRWLFSSEGNIIDASGNPVREMGYNTMQMLSTYAADTNNQANTAPQEIPKLAAHNIRHIRAMSVPMFWRGDYVEFLNAGDEYWARMEQILDMCYNNGIGVQFDVIKHYFVIPNYLGENVSTWTDKNSATFQHWLNTCFIPLIDRFGDHPAISSWSVINELNMYMEYGNVPEVVLNPDGTPSEWHGTPASYDKTPENLISEDEFVTIQQNIVDEIKARDPIGRMIVSGNNGRLTTKTDDEGYYRDSYCAKINQACDTISMHHYYGHTGSFYNLRDELVMHRQIGSNVNKPFVLQEIGTTSNPELINSMCRQIYQSGTQLTYWWYWRWSGDENANHNLQMHPQHVDPNIAKSVRILDRWNRKMRAAGHWPTETVSMTQFSTRPRPMGVIESDGTGKIEIPTANLDIDNGFSFAFWCKPNQDILDSGTLIACSDSTELNNNDVSDGLALNIFGNGAMNVGISPALKSSDNSYTIGTHKSPLTADHEWMHVVIQGNWNSSTSSVAGLTVFVNGKLRGKVIPASGTFAFPDKPITLFSHNNLLNNGDWWSNREHNLSFMMADFIVMNRAMTAHEVQTLFFHNRIPSRDSSSTNIAIARWTFENGSLVDSISGITATSSGGITATTNFVLPTKY